MTKGKGLRKSISLMLALTCVLCAVVNTGFESKAEDSAQLIPMFRLYNPNTGEHFFTSSQAERDNLILAGWNGEYYAWMAPEKSNIPVYRLYNPNTGDHHYTTSAYEKEICVQNGWNYENIGWYSSETQAVPVYKQYNPNAVVGTHNYTISAGEAEHLISAGWCDENIGWYGVNAPFPAYPAEPERPVSKNLPDGAYISNCAWNSSFDIPSGTYSHANTGIESMSFNGNTATFKGTWGQWNSNWTQITIYGYDDYTFELAPDFKIMGSGGYNDETGEDIVIYYDKNTCQRIVASHNGLGITIVIEGGKLKEIWFVS